ncbi:hypothetical protein, partial [Alicyclobacillus vulcanalis]|uniref:hypothetical protein n=1 Tax=Alicyclobacillus vulcanalis TaxID=252246 RepID=UPI001F33826E
YFWCSPHFSRHARWLRRQLRTTAFTPLLETLTSLAKEGVSFIDKLHLQNILHSIQYSLNEFAHISDEKAWEIVRETYFDLGGAIISSGSGLISSDNAAQGKPRRVQDQGGSIQL